MDVPRLRTIVFAVAMGFTFGLAAVPARAQVPGPGGNPQVFRELARLRAQVAALSGRVAKLEGRIEAADLAGTYSLSDIQSELIGGGQAQVRTATTAGTVTLAADGTGSARLRALGTGLIQGSPWWLAPVDSRSEETFTWTYADGTIHISDGASLTVAAGGRVLTYVSRDTNHSELGILTRLQ